jgi:hypothetical protein
VVCMGIASCTVSFATTLGKKARPSATSTGNVPWFTLLMGLADVISAAYRHPSPHARTCIHTGNYVQLQPHMSILYTHMYRASSSACSCIPPSLLGSCCPPRYLGPPCKSWGLPLSSKRRALIIYRPRTHTDTARNHHDNR